MSGKSLKWATTLFHFYENKEYKEKRDQDVSLELLTINFLSNIINDEDLFDKEEKNDVIKIIDNLNISEVEKKALKKIITDPLPTNNFLSNINTLTTNNKKNLFCYISDIFINSSKLDRTSKNYILELGNTLNISINQRNELVGLLRSSHETFKNLILSEDSFVSRNSICKDIISKEFDKILTSFVEDKNYFNSKNGIIGSILLLAALKNLEIQTPKFLLFLWLPNILLKNDPSLSLIIATKLIINFKKFEKHIEWNMVHMNNLINKSLYKTNHAELDTIAVNSKNFAKSVANHLFLNNENLKVSKFQRSIKF